VQQELGEILVETEDLHECNMEILAQRQIVATDFYTNILS